MGRFFKWVTASCLGTLLALTLLVGILFLIGTIMGNKDKKVASGTFLTFDMARTIPELTDNVAQNNSFSFDKKRALGVHDMRRVLKKAAGDSNIKGLILKSSMTGEIGHAKTSTLTNYLKEFKESGKKIYAYGDFAAQSEYLMMSIADSVIINPKGVVDIRGFSRVVPFYKKLFDKIGLDWNVFYAGDFKSGSEPYRRTNMSEQSKIQTRKYLEDIEELYFDSLAVNRPLDISALKNAQSDYSIRYAEDALKHDLVDGLMYWEEFMDMCKSSVGIDSTEKVNLLDLTDYFVKSGMKSKKRGKEKVAIVYAEGVIEYNTPGPGNISEIDYHKVFNTIEEKDDIKAVVLRVNSPGGNGYTSEQLWHRVERLKAAGIPVVASYGNYAASGGYYISCNADTIVSQPNTLTGSIGVYGMFPDASELLNEKLGIYFDTVKTAPYAVAGTPFHKLRDDENAIFNESIDKMYDQFLTRVADGRGMDKDAVHEVAQGRVWTGKEAINKGLVDILGDLDDAINIAAHMADLGDDYGIRQYPYIEEDFFTKFITQMNVETRLFEKFMGPKTQIEKQVMDQYTMLKQVMQYQEPQYLMPYAID